MPRSTKQNVQEVVDSAGNNVAATPAALAPSRRPADNTGNGEDAIQPLTKSQTIAQVMQALSQMNADDVQSFFKGFSDKMGGASARPADNQNGEAGLVVTSPTAAMPFQPGALGPVAATQPPNGENGPIKLSPSDALEDVKAIFAGQELSEDFLARAATIYEAAVNSARIAKVAELTEKYEADLKQGLKESKGEIVGVVSRYLKYVVEQWMGENKLAVDNGLKVQIAEDFMTNLKSLFESNHIVVDVKSVNVVEAMTSEIAALKAQVNEAKRETIEAQRKLNEQLTAAALKTVSEGLALTEAAKLKTLVEGISFTDVEDFTKKAKVIRESYFNKPAAGAAPKSTMVLTEQNHEEVDGGTVVATTTKAPEGSQMEAYVKAARRDIFKK